MLNRVNASNNGNNESTKGSYRGNNGDNLVHQLLSCSVHFPIRQLRHVCVLQTVLRGFVRVFQANRLLPRGYLSVGPSGQGLHGTSGRVCHRVMGLFIDFLNRILSALVERAILGTRNVYSSVYSVSGVQTVPRSP